MPGKVVDRKLVRKVAEVARLNLSESEINGFSKDMSSILEAFRSISKADTSKVKPSFQPVEVRNVLRHDKAGPGLSRDEALANTRNREEGHFRGPKVV